MAPHPTSNKPYQNVKPCPPFRTHQNNLQQRVTNAYITYHSITSKTIHNDLTHAIQSTMQTGLELQDSELAHEWEAWVLDPSNTRGPHSILANACPHGESNGGKNAKHYRPVTIKPSNLAVA